MNANPDRATAKRFALLFTISVITYVLSLGIVFYSLRIHNPSQSTVIALATIPAVAVMAMIIVLGLFINGLEDDFQRFVLQQAVIGATGCVLAVTSVFGSLEMFTHLPHLPMFLIFPMFWFFFGLCAAMARLKYGGNEVHD
jgi:hypothetical protein